MRNDHEVPLKRLSAEAAAIVISILLAFWIDAWWEERRDSENEQVVLTALIDEFKSKKDTLNIRRAFNEEILKSTRILISASVDSDYSLTAAELDGHLATLWWYNIEDEWESAILDSLISGGHLTNISNPKLRINLAQWPIAFKVVRRRVGRDEAYFNDVLMPFLTEHADLPQVYLRLPPMPGSSDHVLSKPKWAVSEPGDNTHLLDNKEFANILTEKIDRHLAILDLAFAGLDEKLDETILILETQLSK